MDRRDDNYYEAHAQTIDLEEITSSDNNADILQSLRDNDASFDFLQIMGDSNYIDEHDFVIDEGDDLGWLGYFVGNSSTLQHLCIYNTPAFLSANRLGDFIDGLNRNRSIETLYIGADLGSACFRQMGGFFRNNNNLRELFFGNMNAFGVESARSIAFMLSQPGKIKLRKIYFEESDASDAVLAEIAAAIRTHPHLEELNLGMNCLRTDGSVALGDALKACNNPRLHELLLCFNFIDDEGLRALAGGMRNCRNLSKLNLACNESITADGFRSLSTLFQSGHCHLKHLDLSSMNMGANGARAISTGLASLNLLEDLNLSENAIGDDGARALGAGLVNLLSLEKLDLCHNSIGDVGASAIAAGLASLKLLEALQLSTNSIGNAGARAIGAGLKGLQSLKTLNLFANSIGNAGARAIGAGPRVYKQGLRQVVPATLKLNHVTNKS